MTALHRGAQKGGVSALPPQAVRRPGRRPGWNSDADRSWRQQRIREALEHREAGKSYTTIAAEMGVSVSTAFRWTQCALAQVPSESAEQMRKLALLRCEQAMAKLMARLRSGDVSLQLIDGILGLQTQLARLHGITGLDGDDGEGVTINLGLAAPRSPKPANT